MYRKNMVTPKQDTYLYIYNIYIISKYMYVGYIELIKDIYVRQLLNVY